MGKNKLGRFAEFSAFPNSFEFATHMKGKWREYFGNSNPITLEVGCGKGEYTTGLATLYPERNFMGLDIKGSRMWRGAKTALENQLHNAAFLRLRMELITDYFAAGEVDEIWLTFPDPHLREGKSKKRLSSPRYIERYRNLLKPGGFINLKTDSLELFTYTLEVINELGLRLHFCIDDLYSEENLSDELKIETTYEKMWKDEGKKITYLRFQI